MSLVLNRDYSNTYDPEADFDRWYTIFAARRIAPRLGRGTRILEAGSATGLLTAELCGEGRQITCIERSASYAALARARGLPGVTVVEAQLEEFAAEGGFDHVLATNLLHEFPDPAAILARLAAQLAPGGLMHVTLPNPRSLHRLVALHAGLLEDLCAMHLPPPNEQHFRLHEAAEVEAMGRACGLELLSREGILVKPLPNAEMARLPPTVLEGFDALAAGLLPEHGAVTYFLFRRHG
ncbi:class I SAM-dependent methyltransferase [Roseomonas marmotae]|uniref:Class I SAM-dependent methyltransferase n=1 Tax=Roseomonas marmotae TaxID=2768161 RepID=A0ABS3KF29_9PROT|nr:class I SAM-dependent methyltransferase [Roseomonas marmotae]MBO1076076.1 class I SAM-dependent methyltransferase [Roseomonas marmotae]QTI81315.1 class I SAM-dependent methyltransferase [Roseomonas marmotae]